MIRRLVAHPAVKAYRKDRSEIDLKPLAGLEIKRTLRKSDGSVVAVVDQGEGVQGLSLLFKKGSDYDLCHEHDHHPTTNE